MLYVNGNLKALLSLSYLLLTRSTVRQSSQVLSLILSIIYDLIFELIESNYWHCQYNTNLMVIFIFISCGNIYPKLFTIKNSVQTLTVEVHYCRFFELYGIGTRQAISTPNLVKELNLKVTIIKLKFCLFEWIEMI